MTEEEFELIASRIRNDMRKRIEFCDNVGITLDDYYIKQCGNFEIEDMVKAFENGKLFYEEIINDYGETKQQLTEKDKQIEELQEVRAGQAKLLNQDTERIMELEAQIEKMRCCYNCKHSRTEYEHCRTDKHEKWELADRHS